MSEHCKESTDTSGIHGFNVYACVHKSVLCREGVFCTVCFSCQPSLKCSPLYDKLSLCTWQPANTHSTLWHPFSPSSDVLYMSRTNCLVLIVLTVITLVTYVALSTTVCNIYLRLLFHFSTWEHCRYCRIISANYCVYRFHALINWPFL